MGLTITFSSVDWAMSLEPHWFSTIYGVLFMGGPGALGARVRDRAAWPLLGDERAARATCCGRAHFHDLGKLMLAFVMLWAYFNFSQFLIIWSGNLPEEMPWYLRALTAAGSAVALVLVVFHFVLPFLLLLSRDLKRNARALALVAAVVLVVRAGRPVLADRPRPAGPRRHGSGLRCTGSTSRRPSAIGGLWLCVVRARAQGPAAAAAGRARDPTELLAEAAEAHERVHRDHGDRERRRRATSRPTSTRRGPIARRRAARRSSLVTVVVAVVPLLGCSGAMREGARAIRRRRRIAGSRPGPRSRPQPRLQDDAARSDLAQRCARRSRTRCSTSYGWVDETRGRRAHPDRARRCELAGRSAAVPPRGAAPPRAVARAPSARAAPAPRRAA